MTRTTARRRDDPADLDRRLHRMFRGLQGRAMPERLKLVLAQLEAGEVAKVDERA
jgi:hypothetical protein